MRKELSIEDWLEKLLHWGTWTATLVVGLGVFLAPFLAKLGIGLFILIPVGRVIGLLMGFTKQEDYRMAIVAAVVLGIIMISFLFGVLTS